jgi:Secretion system C-terminal sorting domain
MKKALLLAGFVAAFSFAQAQTNQDSEIQLSEPINMSHICGTHPEATTEMRAEAREIMERGDIQVQYRGAKRYIPIKWHATAKTDKTGRVQETKILENLCQLNKDYADQDVIFYIKDGDINYIDNDGIWSDPGKATTLMNLKKDKSAINMWLCNAATKEDPNTLGGVILGYYTPTRDWLVIKNSEVNKSAGTISHELGHYFSLAHPFKGWDGQSFAQLYGSNGATSNWGQVKELFNYFTAPGSKTAPDGVTPVECINGNNCKTAGDGVCDTPPDYNFGFGWNACTPFPKKFIDPCGDTTNVTKGGDVDENNFMGYFIGCADSHFSTEQKALMLANYNSNKRAYLKISYTGSTEAVSTAAVLKSPLNKVTLPFNAVSFDWDDVPNASRYILQVDDSGTGAFANFSTYIIKGGSSYIASVKPSKSKIIWRVLPYNELGTCLDWSTAQKGEFSSNAVTVNTEIEGLNAWAVSPNPAERGATLTLTVDAKNAFEANVKIVAMTGQVLQNLGTQSFTNGVSNLSLDTETLSAGMYIVTMQTKDAIVNKYVVIK